MTEKDREFFSEAHITPEEIPVPGKLRGAPRVPDYTITAEDDVQWLAQLVQAQSSMIEALMGDATDKQSSIRMWRGIAAIAVIVCVVVVWIARH